MEEILSLLIILFSLFTHIPQTEHGGDIESFVLTKDI